MTTKKKFLFYTSALIGAAFMLFSSCEKEDKKNAPTLSTTEVTEITQTTATLRGNITDDGGASVTARGVCWSTSQNPTIIDRKTQDGNDVGNFTSNITGLEPNTTYYVRAYATNSVGTQYCNQVSLTTLMPNGPGETITDIDNNVYNTIWVNGRQWMKENLKTTKYKDGTSIATEHSVSAWADLTIGLYTIYPHSEINGLNSDAEVLEAYGALYNKYAVLSKNLCPTGWSVPSYSDWQSLIEYAGGFNGALLKSYRTEPMSHPRWNEPNNNANDSYGFSALPGGYYSSQMSGFKDIGDSGNWWSSYVVGSTEMLGLRLTSEHSTVYPLSGSNGVGLSVRCIKNN